MRMAEREAVLLFEETVDDRESSERVRAEFSCARLLCDTAREGMGGDETGVANGAGAGVGVGDGAGAVEVAAVKRREKKDDSHRTGLPSLGLSKNSGEPSDWVALKYVVKWL